VGGRLGLTWTRSGGGNLWQVQLPATIKPFEALFYAPAGGGASRRLRSRLESASGSRWRLRNSAAEWRFSRFIAIPLPRRAGHELVHQEVDSPVGVEIEQCRDVGVEESRQGACFESQPPLRRLVEERVLLQHLERHVALEPRVLGTEDHTHAAFPQAFDDAVPSDRLTDHVTSGMECAARGCNVLAAPGACTYRGQLLPAVPPEREDICAC